METEIKQVAALGARNTPAKAAAVQSAFAPMRATADVSVNRSAEGTTVKQSAASYAASDEAAGSTSLDQAVRDLNAYVQNVQRSLQFDLDDESGHTVVRVLDAETDEVIRQMPSEEVLALARHLKGMSEGQHGLFLQEKA